MDDTLVIDVLVDDGAGENSVAEEPSFSSKDEALLSISLLAGVVGGAG